MSRRLYRAYDSTGTVKVTTSKNTAEHWREKRYPVEVWEADITLRESATYHDIRRRLKYNLDGGRGPYTLSGLPVKRLGALEEVEQ